ncbi:hypothetical protein BT63DRAFT_439507 [Microthyrium microscopicum]|uniref:Cell wall protein n=1 Tax=Microthyrium microscopicum TaxID=703497 RepID=A0A6A6UFQ4_9PEZI|nr:hypothetical protein BT63DRAFT_439507 [Microthyrium microscopicum]
MQLTAILSLALFGTALAGPVRRDLQTINGALGNIQKSVMQLDTDIKTISGQPGDVQKIQTDNMMVQQTLQQSTTMVMATDAISLNDAITLQQTAGGLTTQVMTTVMDLTAKKAQINMIPGAKDMVVQGLMQQKTAANSFAMAVVSKVPALAQNIATQQTGQISAAFDMGIQAFST